MADPALAIRDATADRLKGLARYFPEGQPAGPATIIKGNVEVTTDDDLPCLLVYVPSNSMQAEGDANAGIPNFIHSVTLVVQAFIKGDDTEAVLETIDPAGEEIIETLLSDPEWLKLFEAVTQIERRPLLNNEKTGFLMAGVAVIFSITYRTDWPPVIPDAFGSISLRTPDGQLGTDYPLPQT